MILAFDTYYFDNKAQTICLAFENWTDTDNFSVFSETLEGIAEYVPGEFYKRELPCILSLLQKIPFENINTIVVDGFVFLDDENKLGLGGHLYKELEGKIPVIGVAKSNFASIIQKKRALKRGQSENPLFVTAIGVDLDEAAAYISSMAGIYRIPTLLKQLDLLSRQVEYVP